MSWMQSLFGGPQSTPAQQPAPGNTNTNQPAPGTQGGTPGTAPNGAVPAQQEDPNKGGVPGNSNATPLAQFDKIWETAPNPNGEAPASLFAGLDPAKVMESAKKVNFTQGITQEQLAAIAAGGESAIKAFQEGINNVAQTVYGQSAVATAKIVEQALNRAQEQYDAKLPTMVKKFSANESLLASNPLLSNPAIQPLVGALQEQLVRKNPNASSAEIQQQVTDYFSQLGTVFAPKPAEPKGSQAAKKVEDWSSFLEN